MFGGIVETVGRVQAASMIEGCKHFRILPDARWYGCRAGDSVAVNGVCLTVTEMHADGFDCSAVPETLAVSNLGELLVGSWVNLERALPVQARIGGHYVQGHVDGVGEISAIEEQGAAWLVTIAALPALTKYMVKKGYVALDGMSITLVAVDQAQLQVTFIPYTRQASIVKQYRIGSRLNVEVDILGKYVEKLLGGGA